MAKIGYPPASYRARSSRDYLRIEPVVLQYLEEANHPDMVIQDEIEKYVLAHIDPKWMNQNRIPHCISEAMHLVGYDRRSNRGRCWDQIYDSLTGMPVVGWCIRVADFRSKPKQTWKKSAGCGDSFKCRDTHPIKTRKRQVKLPSPDKSVKPLTAFIPL